MIRTLKSREAKRINMDRVRYSPVGTRGGSGGWRRLAVYQPYRAEATGGGIVIKTVGFVPTERRSEKLA
ncbi:MAG: hypothetical protein ACK5Q5_16895 [Planctomycetaceae bacterium]